MAVLFTTTDNVITCGTADTLLTENGACSVSCWVYPFSTGSSNLATIISRLTDDGTAGIHMRLNATSAVAVRVLGATALLHLTTNSTISLNSWQHILLTWNGTTAASQAKIYINGVEPNYQTTTNGSALRNNIGATTRIGVIDSNIRSFDGYIDEMAVWNAVIGAGSITTLSASRVKGIPMRVETANLVSYWPMDDVAVGVSGDGATFRDRQGTNTGTGSNGTADTGCIGTQHEVISYLLANDKKFPRGISRGICRL